MTMPRKNKISEEKLAEIISLCDPEQVAKKFSTAGRCGNEGLFRFCQYLKQEIFSSDVAMPYIREWYKRWREKLVDETGHQLAIEDIEVQADEVWDKVKFSIGGQLKAAVENAQNRYDEIIPELDGYGGKPEKLLALVCFELQQSAGRDDVFFISGYKAAEVMGLDRINGQKRARLTLKVFIRKGIISLAKRGNQRRSTRYRYSGSPPNKGY
jgi:hypothetical protein